MYRSNYLVMQWQVIQSGLYKPSGISRLWRQVGAKLVRMHTIVKLPIRSGTLEVECACDLVCTLIQPYEMRPQ
jgi:hypothetical protein